MLQQTTVAAAKPYFERFVARWPSVAALAAAERDDLLSEWAGLGYYARARNLHACAGVVAERLGGVFPDDEEGLRALPGVGAYTAAAIAAIAFGRRAVVVDGNVERVVARLRAIETPLPDAKPELRAAADALTPTERPGDYAQAMMDLGATVCAPRAPACGVCPAAAVCRARALGRAEALPARRPKPPKPTRTGVAFVLLRGMGASGEVLLTRRPDGGLLGGMTGLPTTAWREGAAALASGSAVRDAPLSADWRICETPAKHTFTHFKLLLSVACASVRGRGAAISPEDFWRPRATLDPSGLPTVMRKALSIGLAELDAAASRRAV